MAGEVELVINLNYIEPIVREFWMGAAQTIASNESSTFSGTGDWAKRVADKADALTMEFLDRMVLPRPGQ